MKRRTIAGVLLLGAVAARAHAAQLCVDPAGTGGCFRTVQAAVNGARAGDVVSVAAGRYFESVVVGPDKTGLQIVGLDRELTIIDAGRSATHEIVIAAPDAQIRSLSIRNAVVRLQGDRTRLSEANVTTAPWGTLDGVVATGVDVEVLSCRVRSAGILVDGARARVLVQNNQISNTDTGIYARNGDTRIYNNQVEVVVDGIVVAKSATVRSNIVRGVAAEGIAISYRAGPVLVENNAVYAADVGILTTASDRADNRITANQVYDTASYGMFVANILGSTAGGSADGNTLTRTNEGLVISAAYVSAQGNHVVSSGRRRPNFLTGCLVAAGEHLVVEDNDVVNCGTVGVMLEGTHVVARGNSVFRSQTSGLYVYGSDNSVLRNTITNSLTQGIEIQFDAQNTLVEGNTVLTNRMDICDAGIGTVLRNNRFGMWTRTCDAPAFPRSR